MLMRLIKCYGKKLILKELKSSYKFFIKDIARNRIDMYNDFIFATNNKINKNKKIRRFKH